LVNPVGDLHRRRQRAGLKEKQPLPHQRRIQKQGTIKGMAQGFGALVTNLRLRRSHASGGR
jgi:hypothetical protein